MIRIENISRTPTTPGTRAGFKTKGIGTAGQHMGYLDLAPGERVTLPRLALKDWPASAKQALAEYSAWGVLEVAEVDATHLYQDKGNVLAYSTDYLLVQNSAVALASALTFAADFHAKYNAHVLNLRSHTAVTAIIGEAIPTNAGTLLTWLTGAAGAQIRYTAHTIDAAAHSTIDVNNVLVPVVPVDIPTSAQALIELARAYNSHKTWLEEGTAAILNIPAILTY